MRLADSTTILQRVTSLRSSGVSVEVNSEQSWVELKDQDGMEIFLQDQSADDFQLKCEELSEQYPAFDFTDVQLAVADYYIRLFSQ